MVPNVDTRVRELQERIGDLPVGDLGADINRVLPVIINLREQLQDLKEHARKLNSFQVSLQMEFTMFEKLEEFEAEFNLVEKLWCGRKEWVDNTSIWMSKHFHNIDIEFVANFIERL
jgi:dynein heavy chain